MTKKLDKFKVGDTAWAKGDPYRRPVLWTEYRVLERTKTGYVIQRPGVSHVSSFAGNVFYKPETVSAIKVNRGDYLTTQEKEDWIWANDNRNRIVNLLTYGKVDATTLRKVAEVIGYLAGGQVVSPAELEAEVEAARQGVRDAETALNVAEDRLIRALKAQEIGAAVGTRPAEYKPYDNEIPVKLFVRATQVGLRDFFSAPKDAP